MAAKLKTAQKDKHSFSTPYIIKETAVFQVVEFLVIQYHIL